MATILNNVGFVHAKQLIKDGKIDYDSSWSFDASDSNAILGDPPNWDEYEKWFLGVDTEANDETKEKYKYPYGKDGKVYRRGVIAVKIRASQQGVIDIRDAADELLQMIDADDTNKDATKQSVFKVFRAEIKSVDTKNKTVEAVVSSQTTDRMKEVVLASAWKKRLSNYLNHPVLLSSHNYSDLSSQIGVAEEVKIKGDKLIAKFRYFVGEGNPEADWAFKLASKGIAAYSVGFIPYQYTTDEAEIKKLLGSTDKSDMPNLVYKDVELLEISQVLVPANPSALLLSYKGISDPVVESIYADSASLLDYKKDEELVEKAEIEEEVFTTSVSKDVEKSDEHSNINEWSEMTTKELKELRETVEDLALKVDELFKAIEDIKEKDNDELDSFIEELQELEELLESSRNKLQI